MLDLYRTSPGDLDDLQWRDACDAADTAALMLIDERTGPGVADGSTTEATLGRAEIHQATGMVIAQLALTAVDALARLRAHAFASNRRLDDVAHDVIEQRLVFTPDPTAPADDHRRDA